MNAFLKTSIATAALSLGLAAQASVVVDDFNQPGPPNSQSAIDTRKDAVTSDTIGASAAFNGTMIGGSRDIFVIKETGADSSTNGVRATVENGVYSFGSDPGNSGVGVIRWDGAANTTFNQSIVNTVAQNVDAAIASINPSGFAATDLTAGGATGFAINVISADFGFNFTLQAFSVGGDFSSVTLQSLGGPGAFFIPYTLFSNIGPFVQCAGNVLSGCVDFTQITALQAIINYPGAAVVDIDLTIDLVQGRDIPEPGALALAGLALLGAGVARRRAVAKRAA